MIASRTRALLAALLPPLASAQIDAPPAQLEQYAARAPKTVLELQQFRRSETLPVSDAGGRSGQVELIDLHPGIRGWYLLSVQWEGAAAAVYHLESIAPHTQRLRLDAAPGGALLIEDTAGATARCELWAGSPSALEAARAAGEPYAPLCEQRLYLRNRTRGHQTNIERVTDFLRDHVWGGEEIVVFVREQLYRDAFLERADPEATAGEVPAERAPDSPLPASLAPGGALWTAPGSLGIDVELPERGEMRLGEWYRARATPGVFASEVQPDSLAPEILASHARVVNPLDAVERSALVYLIAFDLARFELGYEIGTEHPRVGWSERTPQPMRDPRLPGPDGIDDIAPLVATGMVNPRFVARTAATFTGGFKRMHGAFRHGELATVNSASHYGFIEQGVVLSKLQPRLATLLILEDGTVDLRSWSDAGVPLLARIRHARQNGVPIIEGDPASGEPVPGTLVGRWGAGNWAASKDSLQRTVRAGLCLQETGTHRFLIYGYFSSATPSAMARVFQGYACRYAMLLDINALEHTYLALYREQGGEILVQHLVRGMEEVDTTVKGRTVPRFIGYPDNRDFFYVLRREAPVEP